MHVLHTPFSVELKFLNTLEAEPFPTLLKIAAFLPIKGIDNDNTLGASILVIKYC